MNVDPAGAVCLRAACPEFPDDLLQSLDVLVLEERGDDLTTNLAVDVADSRRILNGAVAHGRPCSALAVLALPAVIAVTIVADGVLCSEMLGNDLCRVISSDSVSFNLDSEALVFDQF